MKGTVGLEGFAAAAMAVTMIAAFLLGIGGLHMVVRRRERRKGLLMLAAAAVLVANVMIWTV